MSTRPAPVDSAVTLAAEVVDRTMEICAVPGPPLRESDRAAVVQSWWRDDGLAHVTNDGTGNVWARLRPGTGRAIVVCAHLDTVFGFEEPHGARREGGRMYGPSVGDDSVALAALSTLRSLLPPVTSAPVWALATVGEEGLGDLAGAKAALDHPLVPVGALIAVEGNYLGRVCTVGVGSARWQVAVEGPGGHAWEASTAPSAVHEVARMVTELCALPSPQGATTSINVGRMQGGEAINARARRAELEVDVRSDDPEALTMLEASCARTFASADPACTVTVTAIGRRPAGRIAPHHPLVRAAVDAQRAVGVMARLTAASTDANAAHARGVPAVAVGITEGSGEHTHDEWIALSPIPKGLRALAQTVASYDRSAPPIEGVPR